MLVRHSWQRNAIPQEQGISSHLRSVALSALPPLCSRPEAEQVRLARAVDDEVRVTFRATLTKDSPA